MLARKESELPATEPAGVEFDFYGIEWACQRVKRMAQLLRQDIRILQRERQVEYRPLLDWARHYLPAHFKLPPSRMHEWLAGQLDRADEYRGLRLNVIGPRGSAKSTLVTLAWVLRAALECTERYIWILSDTKHQAMLHLENLRQELAENGKLQEDYREAYGRNLRLRGHVLRLANGVVIEAYGTGQRIRGKRRREHRPTLIVCDDLQNDDHISSAWQRERTREWFQGTLLKAGTRKTNIVNLATALHRDALALELDRTPGWVSATFKAICHWPTQMSHWKVWEQIYSNRDNPDRLAAARAYYEEHRAAMDEGADLLWPELEDLYSLMQLRAEGGSVAFEREKQGSPVDPGKCEWPESYFEGPLWFDAWPESLQVRVMALDPSKGASDRRGDYSAFVLLGMDGSGMLYVDADLRRRPTPQMVADGVELARNFAPDALGIEANHFQHLLGDQFVQEFARQQMPGVQPWLVDSKVNKQVRIRRLGPLLAGKRVRFKSDSPGAKLLVEQLQQFPLGDHDDGPDALEMAVRLAGELLSGAPEDGLGNRLPVNI